MKEYDYRYNELSYDEAKKFYDRWLRTIMIGTSPNDCYFFNKKEHGISFDECIKKYLNYHDADDMRFFINIDPSSDIDRKYMDESIKRKNNRKNMVRLTESDLHDIVVETVNRILSEEGIHIKPENKGKFTATKKRTGKSTEELKHSKNPLTRKRANFAMMAKRRWKPLKKSK